jgi:hypothetical protein
MPDILIFLLGIVASGYLLGFTGKTIDKEISERSFEKAHADHKFEEKSSSWVEAAYFIVSFFTFISAVFLIVIFNGLSNSREFFLFATPVMFFSVLECRLSFIEYFLGITNIGGRGFRPYRLTNSRKTAVKRFVVIVLINAFLFITAITLRVFQNHN